MIMRHTAHGLHPAKADMAEMEREQMKSNLIPADDVDAWDTMVSNMRAKLLSIPTKSTTQTFAAKNVTEAKSILKDAINDALKELATIQVKTVNPVRASVDEDSAQRRSKSLAPPPDLKISDWADEFRRLSPEASAKPVNGQPIGLNINAASWMPSTMTRLRTSLSCHAPK